MAYKTILVHADCSENAHHRIRLAGALAAQYDAHLVGVAFSGISRYIYPAGVAGLETGMAEFAASCAEVVARNAREALDTFDRIARESGVQSFEAATDGDEASAGMALRARYADLALVGQFDPEQAAPDTMPDFPEYVVLHAGRPVLVVPHIPLAGGLPKRLLIAWDGSAQASCAVTGALPLLERADAVHAVVFNAGSTGDVHGRQPGAELARYLARHGIEVQVHARDAVRVGDALLSCVADLEADMLVMGCYGHSRFRETLLGGVTRTVLQSMTVPVLMAR